MFKIAHISDIHLPASKQGELRGVYPYSRLEKIIQQIDPKNYQAIFFTGDIAQGGNLNAYQLFCDAMKKIEIPCYFIGGNHDDEVMMKNVLSTHQNFHFEKIINIDGWTFIFIDSVKKGSIEGYVSEEEINFLKQLLKTIKPKQQIAIVVHQHLFPVGVPAVDKYPITNAKEVWKVIRAYDQIKLIVYGHVHESYSGRKEHVSLESAPSTSFQFNHKFEDHHDRTLIGFKEYTFDADGYLAATHWLAVH